MSYQPNINDKITCNACGNQFLIRWSDQKLCESCEKRDRENRQVAALEDISDVLITMSRLIESGFCK